MAQALEGNKGDIQNNISRTIGYLDNYHKVPQTQLRLVEQYNWAGNSDPTCPIPPTIPWRDRTQFRHQGPFPGGSVAGVVYSDGNDSTARKWLVAFDRPNQKVSNSMVHIMIAHNFFDIISRINSCMYKIAN